MADDPQKGDGREDDRQKDARTSTGTHGGVIESVVRSVLRDGSIAALGREAMKDIQATYHDVAFGQPEHAREPGAPLSPLASDIEEARDQHAHGRPSPSQIIRDAKGSASVHGEREDVKGQASSPSEIAKGCDAHPPGGGRDGGGVDYAQVEIFPKPGGFVERELQRREQNEGNGDGGNDQSELARGRSLADEQRDRTRGR